MKGQFVKTKMCPQMSAGSRHCAHGSRCTYAHDSKEIRARPDLVRTKLCPEVVNGKKCNKSRCTYAHSHEELNVETTKNLSRYKTTECYFYKIGSVECCKYGAKCRFAHGEHELRASEAGPHSGAVWDKSKQLSNDSPKSSTRDDAGAVEGTENLYIDITEHLQRQRSCESMRQELAISYPNLPTHYIERLLETPSVNHRPYNQFETTGAFLDHGNFKSVLLGGCRRERRAASVCEDREAARLSMYDKLEARCGITPVARGEIGFFEKTVSPFPLLPESSSPASKPSLGGHRAPIDLSGFVDRREFFNDVGWGHEDTPIAATLDDTPSFSDSGMFNCRPAFGVSPMSDASMKRAYNPRCDTADLDRFPRDCEYYPQCSLFPHLPAETSGVDTVRHQLQQKAEALERTLEMANDQLSRLGHCPLRRV